MPVGGRGTSHRDAYQVTYRVPVGGPQEEGGGDGGGGRGRTPGGKGDHEDPSMDLQVWNVILLSGVGRRGRRSDSHWKAFTLSFGCPASVAPGAMPLAQALVEAFTIRPEARRAQAPVRAPRGMGRHRRHSSSGGSETSFSSLGTGVTSAAGPGGSSTATSSSSDPESDRGSAAGDSVTSADTGGLEGEGEGGASMPVPRSHRVSSVGSAGSSASSRRGRGRGGRGGGSSARRGGGGGGGGGPGWVQDALRGRSFASESEFSQSFSDREGLGVSMHSSHMGSPAVPRGIAGLSAARARAAAAAGNRGGPPSGGLALGGDSGAGAGGSAGI